MRFEPQTFYLWGNQTIFKHIHILKWPFTVTCTLNMDSDPDIFAVLAAPCLTEQPQKKPLWMEVHYLQNAPFMCISSSREIYGDFCYAAISSLLMKANCISSPAAQHQGKFKTQHRQHPTLFMLPLPFIPVWSRAWPDHQKLIYSALRSRSGAVSAVDMVLMDEERSSKRRRVSGGCSRRLANA